MIEFIPSNNSKNILNKREDLFDANNLLGDKTQEILLPYVQNTECLISEVIKKYDHYGEVMIFPSLDLGIPNNKVRLAGGFATGMMICWKCQRKLAFVDTTMNVCSSGYFELDNIENVADFFNKGKILSILRMAKEKGFDFNLTSGNHFLMLCRSQYNDKYYLITHFSDMRAKDSQVGLYPNENSWYTGNINTYFGSNGRYIRYLVDECADRFYEKVKELKCRNELIHYWFAKEFCGNKLILGHIYHHYGMPRENIVIIGSFLAKSDDVLPIFTNDACPIYLFKPLPKMWHIRIEDEEFYLIPHGWGQRITNLNFGKEVPYFEIKNDNIRLVSKNSCLSFKLKDNYHFPNSFSEVRNFECSNNIFFKKADHYLNGDLIDILHQKAIYSMDYEKVRYYE